MARRKVLSLVRRQLNQETFEGMPILFSCQQVKDQYFSRVCVIPPQLPQYKQANFTRSLHLEKK